MTRRPRGPIDREWLVIGGALLLLAGTLALILVEIARG